MPRLYAILDRGYGQVALGPFEDEEPRNAGVRQNLNDESADPYTDTLHFADLNEQFQLDVYFMDMRDFMPEEDDDDEDDAEAA